MRFNTFNEVAKWYENTKPIVSKYHKAEDNVLNMYNTEEV